MDKQQLSDYYYGYNLRLADELGEFDKHLMQPVSLEGKKKLNKELQDKILKDVRTYPHGYTEEQVITEIFNEHLQ